MLSLGPAFHGELELEQWSATLDLWCTQKDKGGHMSEDGDTPGCRIPFHLLLTPMTIPIVVYTAST